MRGSQAYLSGSARFASLGLFFVLLSASLVAQTSPVAFGIAYTCPFGQMKVYSCTGHEPTSSCEAQIVQGPQAGPRNPVTYPQVMAIQKYCHLQTPAEAQAAVTAAPAAPTSANGISVGDSVQVLTGFGWTPAKVVAVNGNSYSVVVNGIQVTKDYPNEVRRVGGATQADHANGQYRLGDRVQVNFEGHWIDTKIVTEMGKDYQVSLPGNRTIWATGQNLRPAPAAAPAPAVKAGVPPKPGLSSCAGKVEGRYATTGSAMASFTITFRSGQATMTDGGGNEDHFECWMGGGKILLHQPGKPNLDMPIDINNDGTLQTPMGEIKKKGN